MSTAEEVTREAWKHTGPGVDTPGALNPFRKDRLAERALPFAVVAVVAELSVALPPGPRSGLDVALSAVLLALSIGAVFLPWDRIAPLFRVLVPLAYIASVLFLELSLGQISSGVGIVILAPLVWTALMHRRWESAVVVAAVVGVEIVTALVPIELAAAVIARRAFFWAVLAVLVSVAIQGLRARSAQDRAEIAGLQEELAAAAVAVDRDRIAHELHRSTMNALAWVNTHLVGTAQRTTDAAVRDRVIHAANEVDATLVVLRQAIFGLNEDMETDPGTGKRDHGDAGSHEAAPALSSGESKLSTH